MTLGRARQNGAGPRSLPQPTTPQLARKRRCLRPDRFYEFVVRTRGHAINKQERGD